MHATLAYTAMRLLLFVASLVVLYLIGLRAFPLVGFAVLISGIASFVLLSRQRDAMSGAVMRSLRTFRSRLDAGTRSEDDG
ncbi:MAG: DUF4229 domain-containing protein [Streptosporangiaceae bacterium]